MLVALSLGTAPAHAAPVPTPAPGERDLSYDLGVQAEVAGDHARAATAYERAYRLTPPAETGPRLLFLRAAVAARLRVDDGSPATRVHLCHAQATLRDYLRDADSTSNEEHTALGRVDHRLSLAAGPDCATLLGPAPPGPVAPPPVLVATPVPSPARRPLATPTRTPIERTLLATGIIGLGVGVGGLATAGTGLHIGVSARNDGLVACHASPEACTGSDPTVLKIRERGDLGDTLANIGAVVGGLGVFTGAVLIVVGERLRLRRRTHTTIVPAGLGLAGRF